MTLEELKERLQAGEVFYVKILKGKGRNHILKIDSLWLVQTGYGISYLSGVKVKFKDTTMELRTWQYQIVDATDEYHPDSNVWPESFDVLGVVIYKGDIVSSSGGGTHRIGRVEAIATSGIISCTNVTDTGKFKINPLGGHRDNRYTNVLRLNDIMDTILMNKLAK